MATRILVVDDDPVIRDIVSAVLRRAGHEVIALSSSKDALDRVDEIQPAMIVSDVTMPEMDGYELTRRLRAKPSVAQTPIIILTSHDSAQEKIRGFESGADDYLTKPFDPPELEARVRVLLRRTAALPSQAPQAKGKTIAVFSLRGGVGVSTIATNLAVALAQLWNCATGLIDLALVGGQSALMLNLSLRTSWADLARIPTESLDAEVVRKVLLAHPSGAYVLAAPNRPEQGEPLTGSQVSRVIAIAKEQFPYVILDLPHDFRETTLAGLDNADQIVVALAPEMASLHATASALDVFETLQYPQQSLRLALNWVFERRGLPRKDIEDALQHPIDVVIPFASEMFVPAINRGVPTVLEAPTSPVGALLEDFAYYLSQADHQQNPPATPSPAWQRVAARLQQRQQKRA